MSIYGWLSLLAQATALAFVLGDLYRGTPSWQRTAAATRVRASGWLRRLLRLQPKHRKLEASDAFSLSQRIKSARSAGPGPPPGRDTPIEERLEWVEQAVDTAFRELDSEALRHDKDVVGDVVERVADLRAVVESDVGARRRPDQVRGLRQLEAWAAVCVFVGIVFAVIDAVVRSV